MLFLDVGLGVTQTMAFLVSSLDSFLAFTFFLPCVACIWRRFILKMGLDHFEQKVLARPVIKGPVRGIARRHDIVDDTNGRRSPFRIRISVAVTFLPDKARVVARVIHGVHLVSYERLPALFQCPRNAVSAFAARPQPTS